MLLHPVYLLGIMRRLLALIPSHSSVAFYRPFVHQEPLLSRSQPKVHVVLLMSTDGEGIPQRLQLCGGTFLKESAPCCQIFSFFSCLFPPCCHSGFLTAGRESVEPESGKEKQSITRLCFCLGLNLFSDMLCAVFKLEFKPWALLNS